MILSYHKSNKNNKYNHNNNYNNNEVHFYVELIAKPPSI